MQAAFGLLAWLLGTRLEVTGIPVLDALGFVVWVMLIVNGINLLDNSDGLAASTVLVSSVGAAVIAVIYGQALVSILALALAGTAAGFLGHNWFPARVYMGDAGAYFLGFLLAVVAVRLRPEGASALEGIAIAVLIVLLPIVDTIYVVTKRFANGIHPFTAGRDHLSHVLQGNGRSVPGSTLVLQGVSILGVSAAVAIAVIVR
jgi:UDP-GlcNAc:undecaprenyl-phosphate GlcNAc-1-phosphate transferase